MKNRLFFALSMGTLLVAPCLLSPSVWAASQDEVEDDEYLDVPDSGDEAVEDDGKVVTLTGANFDDIVKKTKNVLVEFYAPWCGHCKSLAPEYSKASVTLQEKAPEVVVAKVDATVENELAEKYGVQGFPTMVWFHEGEGKESNIGRDADSIVSWVMKKTGPAAVTITTMDELKKIEEDGDLTVFGYFDLSKPSPALKAFEETCRDITFPCTQTSDSGLGNSVGLGKDSFAVITSFEDYPRTTISYSGAMEKESMEKFITAESLPTVVPFTSAYTERIFSTGVQHHLLYVGSKSDLKTTEAPFAAFSKIAKEYKGKGEFVFVAVDKDGEDSEAVLSFFGLEDATMPALLGFEMEPAQRKFRMKGDLTESGIKSFAAGIKDGSVQADLKSEDIPEEGEDFDGNVKIVVGKSYDTVVTDATKDVLLEVYAPWCGHCKSLEPIYRKLATRFKAIPSVVISKMDGTANEHQDLKVEGFPYIAFYPAKEGAAPIPFEGERTLKALTKFIKEHAVIPYELTKKPATEEAKDEL